MYYSISPKITKHNSMFLFLFLFQYPPSITFCFEMPHTHIDMFVRFLETAQCSDKIQECMSKKQNHSKVSIYTFQLICVYLLVLKHSNVNHETKSLRKVEAAQLTHTQIFWVFFVCLTLYIYISWWLFWHRYFNWFWESLFLRLHSLFPSIQLRFDELNMIVCMFLFFHAVIVSSLH